jgi:hypothetical protein
LNYDNRNISLEDIDNTNNYRQYEDNKEIWTIEKIKDELYIHLISIKINGERKYERQGRDLIYRIPVHQPTPGFIINNSDLSSRLKKELSSLDYADLDIVVRDFISMIYESLNKNYFLLSVKRYGLIFWRVEP